MLVSALLRRLAAKAADCELATGWQRSASRDDPRSTVNGVGPLPHLIGERSLTLNLEQHRPLPGSRKPGSSGFIGSLIVAEFRDLAAAQAWADQDPYRAAGVYVRVTVKPFRKVLP